MQRETQCVHGLGQELRPDAFGEETEGVVGRVNRIAIGGASAGGGIAAALALLAHDRAEIQPVFQLPVYPMLDDRTTTREAAATPSTTSAAANAVAPRTSVQRTIRSCRTTSHTESRSRG
ncbi:MAG: alpha/beta hydrolase fold domain-containing protein [Umezawaea sp.]